MFVYFYKVSGVYDSIKVDEKLEGARTQRAQRRIKYFRGPSRMH